MPDHTTRYDETDAVLKPLTEITRHGYSRFDVFRDWTRLMVHALDRDDDAYLDVLDRYTGGAHDRGDRPADLFAAAFGELRAATAEAEGDVLGDAYEAFGVSSDAFGQHFTPPALARLLAAMQFSSREDGVTRVHDSACGSGRLLVAGARDVDGRVACYGVDRDGVCARMAALNCVFFNLEACIVHGDSLTFESFGAWRTRRTASGGALASVDPAAVGFTAN